MNLCPVEDTRFRRDGVSLSSKTQLVEMEFLMGDSPTVGSHSYMISPGGVNKQVVRIEPSTSPWGNLNSIKCHFWSLWTLYFSTAN